MGKRNFNLSSDLRSAIFGGNRIARRLASAVILFSSVFTLFLTAVQLYIHYSNDLDTIEANFEVVETSQLTLMTNSVWSGDHQQIQVQLDGMLQFPHVEYVSVSDDGAVKWYAGRETTDDALERYFPLMHRYRDQMTQIGVLGVRVSLAEVYQGLWDQLITLLVSNGLKTFLVAIFMLVVFQLMVTRHLYQIATHVKEVDLGTSIPKGLDLGRGPIKNKNNDMLEQVVEAINTMQRSLASSFEKLKKSEKGLAEKSISLQRANYSLHHEIGERSKAEDQLRITSAVFEHTSQAVVITDADANIIDCNQAHSEISGYTLDELKGKNPSFMASGTHDKFFFKKMWKRINVTGSWSGEIWDKRKNGEIFPKRLAINAVRGPKGEITQYVGVSTDITELKKTERMLQDLAFTDSLTGLANRKLFQDRLSHEIKCARRNHTKVALILVDLNKFKQLNDTFGHHVGDEILQEVARRLLSIVRVSDTVARLGGDEFTTIVSGLEQSEKISEVAAKILAEISKPIRLRGREHNIDSSIGISLYPDDSSNEDLLIRHADAAMYHAKEKGRGNIQYFSERIHRRTQERRLLEFRLKRAIANEEFELHYQPQIDLSSGLIVGAEALLRWNDPERGRISPDEFIQVAEDTGMILDIGTWVFKTACKQIRSCLNAGKTPVRISVNLSAVQFRDSNLLEMVENILAEENVSPEWIEFEITESAIMEDADEAAIILERLSALGIKISIDDFGTGYSSLYYLKKFIVDKLKIDREFIRGLPDNNNDVILTSAMINLANSLGIIVLAEGVETKEQVDFLYQQGCFCVQGFYFFKPMPEHEFNETLPRKGKSPKPVHTPFSS